MKSPILLLAITAAVFSSCSTSYKTGQTPDDVYFSPARPDDEYVRVQKNDDREYRQDESYYDDRYLRMKVHNRVMWSDLDDWYYDGSRYNYVSYNNWNNPWTPSTYWNCYYNPYYSHSIPVSSHSQVAFNTPRTFNLNTYNSTSLTNNNYTHPGTTFHNNSYNVPRTNTPSNNNNNVGNFLRDIFSGNKNSSSNSGSSGSGNSGNNNSSSGSSSSGSSSGGSAPVRKF